MLLDDSFHHLPGNVIEHLFFFFADRNLLQGGQGVAIVFFHLLFAYAVYTELIVDAGNGSYFLFGIERFQRYPASEFPTGLFVGLVQSTAEHACFFVVQNVASDLFSERATVSVNIQLVVLQLDGQTDLFTETVQTVSC